MTETEKFRLSGNSLTASYSSTPVLQNVDVRIPDGRITALIGANGSGKSTLLRMLGRIMQPNSGSVMLDGKAIASMPSREVAKTLALLPQNPLSPEGLTVRQICSFGRHPHKALLSRSSREDHEIVSSSLIATGLEELADRQLDQLSGGQRQRAWIAMALAQETPILLLDEPTTYLDVAHQLEVLELLKDLNEIRGRTVVMVVHDLNHAAQYADFVIAVANGRIYGTGSPVDLITAETVEAVFGIKAMVIPNPIDHTPLCLPMPKPKQPNHRRASQSCVRESC